MNTNFERKTRQITSSEHDFYSFRRLFKERDITIRFSIFGRSVIVIQESHQSLIFRKEWKVPCLPYLKTMYRKTKLQKDFVVCREGLQRHVKAAHTGMNVSLSDWRTMITNIYLKSMPMITLDSTICTLASSLIERSKNPNIHVFDLRQERIHFYRNFTGCFCGNHLRFL